jgi:hypothetical protein
MVCNNPFVEMALKSLMSFSTYHDNYDITIIDSGLSEANKNKFKMLKGFRTFLTAPKEFWQPDRRIDISGGGLNPT